MASFNPGRYKIRAGLDATVRRVRQLGGEWVLTGSIEQNGISYLADWSISGVSDGGPEFDLVPIDAVPERVRSNVIGSGRFRREQGA